MCSNSELEIETSGDKDTYDGIRARTREDILQYYTPLAHYDGPFLRIALPCGNIREYPREEDVPTQSLQCNCGEVDYEHWFIVYTGE